MAVKVQNDNSRAVPRCIVEGTLDEILEYILPRIRAQDLEHYKKDIPASINEKHMNFVDSRAAGGIRYILRLTNESTGEV